MERIARSLIGAILWSAAAAFSFAAESSEIYQLTTGVSDRCGWATSGIGDLDGDGFADLVVGVPDEDNNGSRSGAILLFSGMDGTVLFTLNGDAASDYMGWAVSAGGDVNGDGTPDVIGGAPESGGYPGYGYVRVWSGAGGTSLYTYNGAGTYDKLGWSVSNAGDANADGYCDVAASSPFHNGSTSDTGVVHVWSGKDGSSLRVLQGGTYAENLGYWVSAAGDVNQDGFDDLVVSARRTAAGGLEGAVYVISGKDGANVHVFAGAAATDSFGQCVSGAGDVNQDSFPDVIVGAPQYSAAVPKGYADVYSGKDGSRLWHFVGGAAGDYLGDRVSNAGDVNGDGHDDVLVGAYGSDQNGPDAGRADVYSGKDGGLLHHYLGDDGGDWFGAALSAAGDVNQDGTPDTIVGAPFDQDIGFEAGSARVLSSDCGAFQSYGAGCPGSNGQVPVLTFLGCASRLGRVFLEIDKGLPGSSLFVFAGLQAAAIPMNGGCYLNVSPTPMVMIGPAQLTGGGTLSIPFVIPATAPLIHIAVQAFVTDPALPHMFNNSGGVQVQLP